MSKRNAHTTAALETVIDKHIETVNDPKASPDDKIQSKLAIYKAVDEAIDAVTEKVAA